MIVERYKSKYIDAVDDNLSVSDTFAPRLILNELEEDQSFEDDFEDEFDDIYDEYEDQVGISDGEEFDHSVFNIGKPVGSQTVNPVQDIHSFDDLIRFTLNTCERLKAECPQDVDRINCWISNCKQQHFSPTVVEVETPIAFKSTPGFIPLQVEMVSFDGDGNAKKAGSGLPGEASIEDVCTVCADDEF